jgi:glycosyltransferase involved in cell wall biosynthesis
MIPLLVSRLLGRLAVVDVDDLDWGYRAGPISKANRALQLLVPKRCSLVTYHTERLRSQLLNTFGVDESRLYRLPQGVDLTIFARRDGDVFPEESPRPHRSAGTKLVVYPAHLNLASDLEDVFEIVGLARRSLPELRLLVVGGGPRERRLRRLAKQVGIGDVAVFTGHLPPEMVVDYLRIADVGVVYYRDDPVNYFRESMKLREMLSLGLKIVCNDVGDLGDFAAFTYQARTDQESMANELVRVLEQGGDGRERRGMEFVRRNLDWERLGRHLLSQLMGMTASRCMPDGCLRGADLEGGDRP